MNIDMSTLIPFAEKNNIVMILLYGSRATHRFRQDSDIDLGVLFKGEYNYEEVVSGFLKIFPFNKIDVALLNHSDPLLNFQILSKNQIIYCPDKEVYLRFFANTVKKYHDMQKIYRRTDKYLKDFIGGAHHGTVSCHPPKVN
jgi:predicted nucleotidyltransferase